jgi:hypothetical protein
MQYFTLKFILNKLKKNELFKAIWTDNKFYNSILVHFNGYICFLKRLRITNSFKQ